MLLLLLLLLLSRLLLSHDDDDRIPSPELLIRIRNSQDCFKVSSISLSLGN